MSVKEKKDAALEYVASLEKNVCNICKHMPCICNKQYNNLDINTIRRAAWEVYAQPLKFKKLDERAVLPSYAKEFDAGLDVTAIDYHYDYEHNLHVYHTGLAMEMPFGHLALGLERSSNSERNAKLANDCLIDWGYRGELLIKFRHLDGALEPKPYEVGDRICQLVVLPYPKMIPEWVDELSSTERGEGGYGHTGK